MHKALINIILKGCFITFHLITFQLSIFIGFDLVFLLMWSLLSLFWLCAQKKLNKLDMYKSIKITLLHNNDVIYTSCVYGAINNSGFFTIYANCLKILSSHLKKHQAMVYMPCNNRFLANRLNCKGTMKLFCQL